MLDPFDGDLQLYVEVEVRNPKIEQFSAHVTYEISIETNNFSFSKGKSTVRRRYSDFVLLHKLISKEFPAIKTSSLPPKFPFKDHFDPAFIETRRQGLEEFIKKIVSQRIYLSSKALHLFLQSNYPMEEIKEIIQGRRVPVESQNGYVSNSLSNYYSYSNSTENYVPPSQAELKITDDSSSSSSSSAIIPSVSTQSDSSVNNKKTVNLKVLENN